jgi:UDP-glucose 4-epimerase
MKTLVIGGNGFIGTNLVNGLLRDGHSVRVFDRYPSRFSKPNPSVEYISGDFGNQGEVHDVVQGIDCVFHLAYTSLPHTSNEDPVHDIRSNLVDTVQLLQECVNSNVSKFIFVSSGGTVYGIPKQTPITEEHPTDPICSYGITKLAIEKYLQLFHRLHGLDYVVTRISNPYGEHQNPNAKQGAIGVFLGNIAQGRDIEIWGDGKVVRDYIYIGDAVNALIKAIDFCPAVGGHRIFNVGAGQGVSLTELIETMKQVVGKSITVKYTSTSRPEDVPVNVLDITRARSVLGWEPKVNLPEGLEKTWLWMKSLKLASDPQSVR